MARKRKSHSAAFKAQVALAALKEGLVKSKTAVKDLYTNQFVK